MNQGVTEKKGEARLIESHKLLTSPPFIQVVLLNWNGGENTLECLNSIFGINYSNFSLLLVDNGSADGVVDQVNAQFPEVKVICNGSNLGFVEGNNIGIRYALEQNADYIFLLNNDTVVDLEILNHFLNAMQANPQLGVVGPKILNYYHPETIESAGGKTSLRFSRSFAIGYGQKDQGQYDRDELVDFVSGCAFFARTDIFEHVDLFDKRYFAYYEDIDICYKLQKQGYQLGYVHQAKVWHKVSEATGGYKNANALFWSTRNRFLFVFNCGSAWEKGFFILYFFGVYAPAYCLVKGLAGQWYHIKAMLLGVGSLIWHKIHYSHDFPRRFVVDCLAISNSKGGVGEYNKGLVEGLKMLDTSHILEYFDYPLSPKKSKGWFGVMRQLWQEQVLISWRVLTKGVDVIHFPAFVSPVLKSAKMIITIHDMAYLLFPEMFVRRYRLYLKLFVHLSARRADAIIAISENTKQDIVRLLNVDEEKIHVIYPGINPIYRKLEDVRVIRPTLTKFSICKEYVLSVGVLEPRKNIRTLIMAFVHMLDKEPERDLQLVIVGGKGWLYDEIFQEAAHVKAKDRIFFTDYVTEEELLHLYNGASIFIYPSLYEGFGLPPLEAMLCGVAVITSNTSSLPEVVGPGALMFPPKDVEALHKLMCELLDNSEKREDLSLKGMKWAKTFTWQKTAEQTLDVYRALVEHS